MHFVNGNRRIEGILFCPARHPRLVMPGIVLEIPHAGSCLRANLCCETVWIRFVDLIIAIARFDVVFVDGPLTDVRYEALPNARRSSGA